MGYESVRVIVLARICACVLKAYNAMSRSSANVICAQSSQLGHEFVRARMCACDKHTIPHTHIHIASHP